MHKANYEEKEKCGQQHRKEENNWVKKNSIQKKRDKQNIMGNNQKEYEKYIWEGIEENNGKGKSDKYKVKKKEAVNNNNNQKKTRKKRNI